MHGFASSGYRTVLRTAVFNACFVGVVAAMAAMADWATLIWTLALPLSSQWMAAIAIGNRRPAIFSTGLFSVAGLVLPMRVDVARAARAAENPTGGHRRPAAGAPFPTACWQRK